MNDPLRLILPMITLKGKRAPTHEAVLSDDDVSKFENEIIQSFIFCEKSFNMWAPDHWKFRIYVHILKFNFSSILSISQCTFRKAKSPCFCSFVLPQFHYRQIGTVSGVLRSLAWNKTTKYPTSQSPEQRTEVETWGLQTTGFNYTCTYKL